jgi:hypothetical protein
MIASTPEGEGAAALERAASLIERGDLAGARSGLLLMLSSSVGDAEERWFASYQVARIAELLREPESEVVARYLHAVELAPTRAEPLYRLARYYRESKRPALAFLFAKRSLDLLPPASARFVEHDVYAWKRWDEVGVAAYWANEMALGRASISIALACSDVPASDRARLESNLAWYVADRSPAGGGDLAETYCIWIVSPPNYAHTPVFDELAQALQQGFAELGLIVPTVSELGQVRGKAIVLGCSRLPWMRDTAPPSDSILFNLEQASDTSGWMDQPYVELLRRHEVWDYSEFNIARLKELGVQRISLCDVGYAPCLTRIPRARVQDVDVLFYGSIMGRRIPILEAVENTGLRVKRLFGVYGRERDEWIGRSKIVLNIHAHPEEVFEIVRVSYLLANKKFVLSEHGRGTDAVERHLAGGLVLAEAKRLPELCVEFAADDARREAIAERGFELFREWRQADKLATVLRMARQEPLLDPS